MSGIYVHIPFCRKACHYCNFHFSTNLSRLDLMVDAINKEIISRKYFFENEAIRTLYFGGGTPSILNEAQMQRILNTLQKTFDLSELQEFTIEINPEDVNIDQLLLWKELGVNRLSIGVQSFFEIDLQYMNRNHTADTSLSAVKQSQDSGFDNITIDLIFGAHTCSDSMWNKNLEIFTSLKINHASLYGLTVEENTALSHFIHSGKLTELDEHKSARQFEMTMDVLTSVGYKQYEISNYAKPGFESKHNSAYWQGKKYLGLGPSAHSFDGHKRIWSAGNNNLYIKEAVENNFQYSEEVLSLQDQYNEWVMTGLRQSEGIDLDKLEALYGPYKDEFLGTMHKHLLAGNVIQNNNYLALTKQGKFISDAVAADFFAA